MASTAPVAALALAAGIPLLRPERVGDAAVAAELARFGPDLGVVVAFGQFLPKKIRELPRLGFLINAHASLLPRHRGAAPIAHAILAGDAETGISIMRVEREMDAGAVCGTRRLAIAPDETRGELEERLALVAADAVAAALDALAAGSARFAPQDATLATFAPKLGAADAALDFTQDAAGLARRVRALAPRPGAAAVLAGERLRLLTARAEPGPCDRPPGVIERHGERIRVATGDGWLVPLSVQRPGGRVLALADWLRGAEVPDGAQLERATLAGMASEAATR